MWLVNKRLGVKVLLAKAWGSGSWAGREPPGPMDMQDAFDTDHYPFTDWELEYEKEEMPPPGWPGRL